jgi:large subunit ribosomal protein L23
MKNSTPYDIIQSRYVTEKAKVLEGLRSKNSNPSLRKCESPKYVFLVDKRANKQEIAKAVEEIYAERKIKVVAVNTIQVKPKERTVRGRRGMTAGFKKAIVTLAVGNTIEDKV